MISQTPVIDSIRLELNGELEDTSRIISQLHIGRNFFPISLDSSLKYFDLALAKSLEIKNYSKVGASEVYRGFVFQYKGDYEKSYENQKLALKYYDKAGDDKGKVLVLYNLGVFCQGWQKLEEAIEYYKKAIVLAKEVEDFKHLHGSYNNLTVVCRELEKYKEAMYYAVQNLKLCEENLNEEIGAAYSNLGLIHFELESTQEAIKFYELALLNLDTPKYVNERMITLNDLAFIYTEEDNLKLAKQKIDEGFKLSSLVDNPTGLFGYYFLQARILYKEAKYKEAIEYGKKAINIIEGSNDIVYITGIYNTLASSYFELYNEKDNATKKNLNLAIKYGEESFKSAENFPFIRKESSENLITLYFAAKNIEKAEEYFHIREDLIKEIYDKDKTKAILEIEDQYQSEKKELEIELLNKENELQTANLSEANLRQKRSLYIAMGVVLLLLLSIWAFFRQKKLTQLLSNKNEVIEKTLGEKQLLLKEIHHRVKNNFQVISSLLGLQSRRLEDETAKTLADEGQQRIQSMAMIHERLYQNDELIINFDDYTKSLVATLISSYQINNAIDVKYDMERISFDVDTAIPLGLILNELITNAIKYGATAEQPNLNISLKSKGADTFELQVKDNGNGIPEGFDLAKARSLGVKLVKSLTRQLKGKVEFSNLNGTLCTINFHKIEANFKA